MDSLDVWPLSVENKAFDMRFNLMVVSIFLKTRVKYHGDNSSGLLEIRI